MLRSFMRMYIPGDMSFWWHHCSYGSEPCSDLSWGCTSLVTCHFDDNHCSYGSEPCSDLSWGCTSLVTCHFDDIIVLMVASHATFIFKLCFKCFQPGAEYGTADSPNSIDRTGEPSVNGTGLSDIVTQPDSWKHIMLTTVQIAVIY